jgi:ribonuclease HI
MKKNELQRALKYLKKYSSDDQKAQQACTYLETVVQEMPAEKKISSSSEMPLPTEVGPADFALFSDGASRGNPGPGAWGALAQNGEGLLLWEASGVDIPTTNNKMELQGAIEAMQWLLGSADELGFDPTTQQVFLYSDSKYVVDGTNSWMPGWKRRGWKKADKKVPENLEQWQEIDMLVNQFQKIKFCWVKGHAGHPQNERCDELANLALNESGF